MFNDDTSDWGLPQQPVRAPVTQPFSSLNQQVGAAPAFNDQGGFTPINAAPAYSLPTPPPSAKKRDRINMFDKDHWRDSLFALGTSMMGGQTLGDSIARAGQGLMAQRKKFEDDETPDVKIGGPDNAFQVVTDSDGNQTYVPIQAFQDYNDRKAAAAARQKAAPEAKDEVAHRAAVADAVMRLPPEHRAAAYHQLLSDSASLGYDMSHMPTAWDDTLGSAYAGTGITPGQRLTSDDHRATLGFQRDKFQQELPLRQANVRSQIATRSAGISLRAQANARAAYKAAHPSSRKAAGSAKLPSGFVLD